MYTKLFQLSIVSRYSLSNWFLKSQSYFSISECVCNPDGSISLECGKDNGVCSCKVGFAGIKCDECLPNVIGDKCDTCQGNFINYPSCKMYEG